MGENGKKPLLHWIAEDVQRHFEMETPFQLLARQMEDISGDEGVLKKVVCEGKGPQVPKNATILVNYSGFLEYFDKPFDTTDHLKHPRVMKLGQDITLYGLEVGLLSMKKGEAARFLFMPQYAFGERGCPPTIPPSATILFEVQVVDFLDSEQVDAFLDLPTDEQNSACLSAFMDALETQRRFGNLCFRCKSYSGAQKKYKQGLTLLNNRTSLGDEEEKQQIEEMKLLYLLNLAGTYLKLEKPEKALTYGQNVLELDTQNTKALYRCGQACLEMGDYAKAEEYLTLAQARKPFDPDITTLLKKLALYNKTVLEEEKQMCSKMFSSLG